jgi:hypothetical protein
MSTLDVLGKGHFGIEHLCWGTVLAKKRSFMSTALVLIARMLCLEGFVALLALVDIVDIAGVVQRHVRGFDMVVKSPLVGERKCSFAFIEAAGTSQLV